MLIHVLLVTLVYFVTVLPNVLAWEVIQLSPSICPFPLLTLSLTFCICMSHDRSSYGIEGQGSVAWPIFHSPASFSSLWLVFNGSSNSRSQISFFRRSDWYYNLENDLSSDEVIKWWCFYNYSDNIDLDLHTWLGGRERNIFAT